MSEREYNQFGGFGGKSTGSGSGAGRSARELPAMGEGVVSFLLDAIQHGDGEFIIPLHESDANELSEEMRGEYDIDDDVTHVCINQLFPIEIEAEGVGSAKKVTYEMLERSVEAGYLTQDELDDMGIEPGESTTWSFEGCESSPQSDINDILNGHHYDEIVSRFGDDAKIRVSAPTASDHRFGSAHERFTFVRFLVSDSEQAALSRMRSRVAVDDTTRSELEEWAADNGFEDKV